MNLHCCARREEKMNCSTKSGNKPEHEKLTPALARISYIANGHIRNKMEGIHVASTSWRISVLGTLFYTITHNQSTEVSHRIWRDF